MALKACALQWLQAANFRRVAAVINSLPAIRTGPGVPPGRGLLPLGAARPKQVINFRSHGGIARLDYHNHKQGTFAAAHLTSST